MGKLRKVIWLRTERGYIKSCLNEDGPAGLIWARRYRREDPERHPYVIMHIPGRKTLQEQTNE